LTSASVFPTKRKTRTFFPFTKFHDKTKC
jgi:hypothetical protein